MPSRAHPAIVLAGHAISRQSSALMTQQGGSRASPGRICVAEAEGQHCPAVTHVWVTAAVLRGRGVCSEGRVRPSWCVVAGGRAGRERSQPSTPAASMGSKGRDGLRMDVSRHQMGMPAQTVALPGEQHAQHTTMQEAPEQARVPTCRIIQNEPRDQEEPLSRLIRRLYFGGWMVSRHAACL